MPLLGLSKHPVLIKKISLNIWLLRDELEAIITNRYIQEVLKMHRKDRKDQENHEDSSEVLASLFENLENHQDLSEMVKLNLKDIKKEYAYSDGHEDDEGEDDANDEDTEAEAPEELEPESTESDDAAEVADLLSNKAPGRGQENSSSTVYQRHPIIPEHKLAKGSSLLTEINIQNIFMFANKEFLVGQSVVIEFVIPRHFIVHGTVSYCRPYNMRSRIISANKMPYRVGVQFNLDKAGERTILREFLKSIEPDLPQSSNSAAKGKDGDEDFSELGSDLDY